MLEEANRVAFSYVWFSWALWLVTPGTHPSLDGPDISVPYNNANWRLGITKSPLCLKMTYICSMPTSVFILILVHPSLRIEELARPGSLIGWVSTSAPGVADWIQIRTHALVSSTMPSPHGAWAHPCWFFPLIDVSISFLSLCKNIFLKKEINYNYLLNE